MESIFGYEYELAAHLLVTDEDAADFLQSQFSNELRPFEAGRSTYGLWLDVKGKVIADSVVLCEGEERFRVLSEGSAGEVIVQKLEQHIIADDVKIEVLPTGASIALVGEAAGAVLEALGFPLPAEGAFVAVNGLRLFRGRRSLQPCFELWSESGAVSAELKTRLEGSGVMFVSAAQMHLARVAAGIPRVPCEIGSSDLPGEGALVGRGVSLTKGCYLGQEVVARMHNVGRPQRALFRISGAAAAPICPIALYNRESKKIGELRSAFSTEKGWQGVGLLKTRYAEVGESLNYDGGSVEIEGLFSVIKEGAK
ncbi:MAG: folate-binding protein YgfZ [Lentimonas sp.]|jgi:folate-binding protein YgfZ